MPAAENNSREMGRERGWVAVSVRTYHSHRSSNSQQRVQQQEHIVDETGATLNAVSRSSDPREEEALRQQLAQSSSSTPTTSIFIRDSVRAPFPSPCTQGSLCTRRGSLRAGAPPPASTVRFRRPAAERTSCRTVS